MIDGTVLAVDEGASAGRGGSAQRRPAILGEVGAIGADDAGGAETGGAQA